MAMVSHSQFRQAAARVPEAIRLAKMPELSRTASAHLWSQVGLIHHYQGMVDLAFSEYRIGLERLVGQPPSEAEGDLLANLVALYLEAGGHAHEAALLCQRGLLLCQELPYPGSSRKLTFQVELAGAKRETGDANAARKLCLEVLNSTGTSPVEGTQRAVARSILGTLALDKHSYEQAIASFAGAISEFDAAYGYRHPDTVPVYLGLATAYGHLHRWEQAHDASRQALDLAAQIGSNSTVAQLALKSLAGAKRHMGMEREAKDMEARARSLEAPGAGSAALRLQVHVSDLK